MSLQLLTPEDLALFEELVREHVPTHNVAIYGRIRDTWEYLSQVEFADPDEIKAARETYCWDDSCGIQVDDDARVSRGEEGDNVTWVGAWVLLGGDGPTDEQEA